MLKLKDKKLLLLLAINILPIGLMVLTSFFMGSKIRTMWMTPFYLYFGVLFLYILKSQINIKKTVVAANMINNGNGNQQQQQLSLGRPVQNEQYSEGSQLRTPAAIRM